MKTVYLLASALCIFFVGCSGGSSSDSSDSPNPFEQYELSITCDEPNGIQGCWITNGCDLLGRPDSNIGYARTIYSFTADGLKEKEMLRYDSTDCATLPVDSMPPPLISDYFLGDTFIASDGSLAQELLLPLQVDELTIEDYSTPFVILNDNELCTSNEYQLLPTMEKFGHGGNEISYENCLRRYR